MSDQESLKTINSTYLLKFSKEKKLGERLEEARILFQLKQNKKINKKEWCKILKVPYTNYIAVIKGKKIIPATVWPVLFELGFSLDWFVSAQGKPINFINSIMEERSLDKEPNVVGVMREERPPDKDPTNIVGVMREERSVNMKPSDLKYAIKMMTKYLENGNQYPI